MTALLLPSHGTASPQGQMAVAALVDAVATSIPMTSVHGCHVDVQQPDVATALDHVEGGSAIVVPLLLSAGYHVFVDIARAARGARERLRVEVTGALGPDPSLARLLARRLTQAGLDPRDSVVLAAAGSSDRRAVADCGRMRRLLAAEIGNPVTLGFVSAAMPPLAVAIASAREELVEGGRVVVANYMLAPGYFSDRVSTAGGDVTTLSLLDAVSPPPPELVEIVLDRYRDALASRSATVVPAVAPAAADQAIAERGRSVRSQGRPEPKCRQVDQPVT